MYTSNRLQVSMGIGIQKFWFPRGNRKHVFFTPVGTLAWPSLQRFHCSHWAVNIVESVRKDTIEYWQNKFKIRMRIYLVNDKAWDLLICFCGSISMAVSILEDALSVSTNLGKHLLFIWLFVSRIKTGTGRTIFCCASFKTNNRRWSAQKDNASCARLYTNDE